MAAWNGLDLLSHFIAELALNPLMLEQYRNDPEDVMEAAGLDEDAKGALRKGDFNLICKMLGGSIPRPVTEDQIGLGSGRGGQ